MSDAEIEAMVAGARRHDLQFGLLVEALAQTGCRPRKSCAAASAISGCRRTCWSCRQVLRVGTRPRPSRWRACRSIRC